MDEIALNRLISQVTTLFVGPEVKKRDFKDKIFAVLILFQENVPPQVKLNLECPFTLEIEINPEKGVGFTPGKSYSLNEISQYDIKNITLPESIFNDFAYIACWTINNKWFIKFNFFYNKGEAKKRIEKSKEFLKLAKAAKDNDIKSYNLFHSVEAAIHAYFFFRPGLKEKITKSRKHNNIQTFVNKDCGLGNFPSDLRNLFNSLLKNRRAIYDDNVSLSVTKKDFDIVEKFLSDLEGSIRQS